jgi:hypothetical protein
MPKKELSIAVHLDHDGVEAPRLQNVKFTFHKECLDEEGIYNPIDGQGTYEGAFQINIHSDSDGYRELGRYFLGLAEFDVRGDPCFHEHHEAIMSTDGRTRLHIICRKDDERYRDM